MLKSLSKLSGITALFALMGCDVVDVNWDKARFWDRTNRSNIPQNAVVISHDIPLWPQAANDYNGQYRRDPNHKAFAVSPDGIFGVSSGAVSEQRAAERAMEECSKRLLPGMVKCVVYDVNGRKVFQPPVTLTRH